jgi:hypothetical protein
MRRGRPDRECCKKASIHMHFLTRELGLNTTGWTTEKFSTEYRCHIQADSVRCVSRPFSSYGLFDD